MTDGYILLDRQFNEWEWYTDIPTKILFIHLLLEANSEAKNYNGIEVKKGQIITSVKKLSEETGLSVRQTRTALRHMQTTNEVTIKTTNKYSLITLENYRFYDSEENETTSKTTSNRQTKTEKSTNNEHSIYKNNLNNKNNKDLSILNNINNSNNKLNNKNINNINNKITSKEKEKIQKKKKKSEVEEIIDKQPTEIQDHLKDFITMRKSIKKPLTTKRAMNTLLKKLENLSHGDISKKQKLLDEAILHNWQTVYEVEDRRGSSRPRNEVFEMLQQGVFDE